jgi:hypothetical protein
MLWHKVARRTGKILMSCHAETKTDAETQLGEGYVVSDVSWRMDVFKFKPVQTVVTDIVQDQKPRGPQIATGYIGSAEACQMLGLPERKFRVLADKYRIRPKKIQYGKRYINGYTPLQVEALRQCL